MKAQPTFNLKGAFADRITESKIDVKAAVKLGLAATAAGQAPKDLPFSEPGILIPYFDINGKRTKFWRYRYLKQPEVHGFAALVKRKPLKYVQAKGTLNELYLPPLIDWTEVANDPLQPIIITEGEFKAACATLHTEYPTIGLGGVWSWKSTRHKMPLITGFDDFNWEQRPVYIIYDSDAVTNPLVMQAENHFAKALTAAGAEPYIVRLPMGDDNAKQGLDDFIVNKGTEALEDLLNDAEVWESAKELHRLNEEVVYIRDPGLILRLDNLQRMSPRAFTDHAFATRVYYEEIVTKKATKLEKKSAPREWITWGSRAEVSRITYAPGEDRITDSRELNIWPGWGLKGDLVPKPGNVKLWSDLLDHLFGENKEARTWFERWCAFPIQHPGTKMYTSAVVWGLRHGTGKSLVGYALGKVYGKNFTEIDDAILKASHNEWAENKQFVMGDEITTGDKREASDRMKTMISRQQLRLNPKYIPSYTVPDVINYYFTSNHPDSFFLEDDDRRFFIHEVRAAPAPDEFYKAIERWIGPPNVQGPGVSALFHHLLNLDLGDFQGTSRALMTASKRDMMQNSRSDLATWVFNLKEDPDSILVFDRTQLPYSLWRSEDLLKIYDPDGKTRVTANGVARELSRQGVTKAASGMGVRTELGQVRLWVLRNHEFFATMKAHRIGEAYDAERKKAIPVRRTK